MTRKLLEGIKHLVHDAPKEAKLLAHTSLYRPMHKYADLVFGLLTQLLTVKKAVELHNKTPII